MTKLRFLQVPLLGKMGSLSLFLDESLVKLEEELRSGIHDLGNSYETALRINSFIEHVKENKEKIMCKIRDKLPGIVTIGVRWKSRQAVPYISVRPFLKKELTILSWESKMSKL